MVDAVLLLRRWYDDYLHKLPQVTVSNQQLNLVMELYAILRIIADVVMEVAVFVLISPSTVCSEWRGIPKQTPTRNLVQDVLDG